MVCLSFVPPGKGLPCTLSKKEYSLSHQRVKQNKAECLEDPFVASVQFLFHGWYPEGLQDACPLRKMVEEACSTASGESSSIYCGILLTNESKVNELTGKRSTKEENSKRLLLLTQLPWIVRTVRWIFTARRRRRRKLCTLKTTCYPATVSAVFP